jgi:ribosomal peptide maturation radical SAM protein 1
MTLSMKHKILLITMPFAPVVSPSIGLTLLKGVLKEKDIAAEILYLNLLFAKKIGAGIYSKIATGFPVNHDMIGEWLFSGCLFPDERNEEQFINEILLGNNPHHSKAKYNRKKISPFFISQLRKAKAASNDFIDKAAELVLNKQPSIIGFTSVFQQQLASLAIAKRIKERNPNIIICFGGANNEGAMGIEVIRKFPFVDFVVSGEGEDAFCWLVSQITDGKDVDDYQGIISIKNIHRYQNTVSVSTGQSRPMDALPFLEYDDYFRQLSEVGLDRKFKPRLLFETSRGCWWGMKNHCTFCGLNGENMKQRTKSAQRSLDEFQYLLERYPGFEISVVDNILDYAYFKDFIPSLIEIRKTKEYELFYEVKANLTKAQLGMLKDSGISSIQPGVESFCRKTLKIMHKGVSPIQNIQLLKWCRELNMGVEWNLLYGFPGEEIKEYMEVAKMIPLLSHLSPPNSCAPIRLDRFSPNFDYSEALGFKDIQPYPTYNYIYSFKKEEVFNLAYYFTYHYANYKIDLGKMKRFNQSIKYWRTKHSESALFYSDNGDALLIWDLRPISKHPIYVLSDLSRALYLLCDRALRLPQIFQSVNLIEGYENSTEEEILEKLDFLVNNDILLFFDSHYLSLAISDQNLLNTSRVVSKIKGLIKTDENSNEVLLSETVFA